MTDSFELRLARVEDLLWINEIKIRGDSRYGDLLVPRPLPKEFLQGRIDEEFLFVLNSSQAGVIGFVTFEEKDGALFIEQASVLPEYQGFGFSDLFLEKALEVADKKGFSKIFFTTNADIAWNAPYFERLGFRVLGDQELTPGLKQALHEESARGKLRRVAMGMELK